MGVVMFYHLTRSDLAGTLRGLSDRALQQGWRVMIRGTDPAALSRLDTQLWQGTEDSFLPHGVEGGPHDADQPILIGQGVPTNAARALALIDGATATEAELATMDRVWILFDGADDARVTAARAQWKAITATGLAAQYWSEDAGKWEKKAESGAG